MKRIFGIITILHLSCSSMFAQTSAETETRLKANRQAAETALVNLLGGIKECGNSTEKSIVNHTVTFSSDGSKRKMHISANWYKLKNGIRSDNVSIVYSIDLIQGNTAPLVGSVDNVSGRFVLTSTGGIKKTLNGVTTDVTAAEFKYSTCTPGRDKITKLMEDLNKAVLEYYLWAKDRG